MYNSVISRHIHNVFDEGELAREAVVANYATTATDGKTYQVEHFKLDDFLRLSEREIPIHAGRVSHEMALAKAEGEFEKFQVKQLAQPNEVEKHFEAMVKDLNKLPPKKPTGRKRGKQS